MHKDKILFTILFIILFLVRRINIINDFLTPTATAILFVTYVLIFGIYFCIKKKENKLFILALSLSVIADIFLSGLFNFSYNQIIGLTIFLLSQIGYALFMNKKLDKEKSFNLLRIILSIFVLINAIIIFKNNLNYLVILSFVYGVNLILNIIESFVIRKEYKFLYIGFILFFLCDLSIAIYFAKDLNIIDLSNIGVFKMFFKVNDLCWLFYMPCLYLIDLSIAYKTR